MFGGRFDVSVLGKVVVCWVGTPLGALVVAALLYVLLGKVLNWLDLDMFQYDQWLRWALIVAGSYGAYALGANNVANVTGAFVGEGMLSVPTACLIGGLAISLGVITYSRGVMMTVGQGLVKLDAFSAFIVVLAEAITVHIYAMVGVPVSTSQAVVGGVLGVGLVRGVRTVNRKVLRDIVLAWLTTPVFGFAGAYACFWAGRQLGWL
jgi:PiT family inorganic phosphate transporter